MKKYLTKAANCNSKKVLFLFPLIRRINIKKMNNHPIYRQIFKIKNNSILFNLNSKKKKISILYLIMYKFHLIILKVFKVFVKN